MAANDIEFALSKARDWAGELERCNEVLENLYVLMQAPRAGPMHQTGPLRVVCSCLAHDPQATELRSTVDLIIAQVDDLVSQAHIFSHYAWLMSEALKEDAWLMREALTTEPPQPAKSEPPRPTKSGSDNVVDVEFPRG